VLDNNEFWGFWDLTCDFWDGTREGNSSKVVVSLLSTEQGLAWRFLPGLNMVLKKVPLVTKNVPSG
jgi:hypothetical protein